MIIQAQGAVIDGVFRENVCLEIEGGMIVSLKEGIPPNRDYLITGVLIPGFVDMHCHGGGGEYFSANEESQIEIAINAHKIHGTTSLCASLVSEPLDVLVEQIERLVPFARRGEIIGIHLEGPYLAKARCGAHDPALLRTPKIEELHRLLEAGKGAIKMVTIAPELQGALKAIKYLVANGVIAAIGHSAANKVEAQKGVDAGATVVTHFPNAVSKLDDEGETLAHVAMTDTRLTLELILDGHHVNRSYVERIYSAAADRLTLVTDAICAAGSNDGHYLIGRLPLTVKDSVARLDSNRSLAGSTLTMDKAFFNMIELQGLSLIQAVYATATLPARVFSLEDRGSIAVGKRADLLEVNLDTRKVKAVNCGHFE